MAKKLKEVRPEDFNVQLLMAAAREGRLFIAEEYNETDKEQIISEVRAYVRRAKAFVTPQYQEIVDDIWEEIFATDDFAQMLMPGSKSRKCKAFDKYNVMRLIGVLREKGVYEQHIYPSTIRLSIGTEHIDDIIEDLSQALDSIKS